jgi:regulator of nonsense transcripts 1
MWIVRRIRHYFGDTYLGTLSRFEEHERRILMILLTLLMEAQQGSIDLDTESNVEAEKDFRSNFHSQWRLLCKLELSQATGIFCTASTAGRKALRWFQPNIILLEEASQLTDPEVLNAIIRFYQPKEFKVVISGDPKQLPPTVLALKKNEGTAQMRLSLLDRQIQLGAPHI